MRRMKVKELVAEPFASVPELPPKYAPLMREITTRLEATSAALNNGRHNSQLDVPALIKGARPGSEIHSKVIVRRDIRELSDTMKVISNALFGKK